MVLLVRMASDPQVMGPKTVSRPLAMAGGVVGVIVGVSGLFFALAAAAGTF